MLRHQPFMLAVTAATLCLSVYLYVVIPEGFFPQQDTGLMAGGIEGAQDTSFCFDAGKIKTIYGHRHERSGGKNNGGRSGESGLRKIPGKWRSS